MLRRKYHKNIEKEIAKIENLLADKEFIILNESFPIDKCQTRSSKSPDFVTHAEQTIQFLNQSPCEFR
jgi:hypothetical protein